MQDWLGRAIETIRRVFEKPFFQDLVKLLPLKNESQFPDISDLNEWAECQDVSFFGGGEIISTALPQLQISRCK